MKKQRIRKALVGVRAGVPKYTREIVDSVREARSAKAAASSGVSSSSDSPAQTDLADFHTRDFAAAWIGHATVLLRIAGKTILTDPVFSDRVGMTIGGVTLGVRRLLPPAVHIAALPSIDLVLLSHAHYDHLDRPSLKRLAAGPARDATVITASGTRRLVPSGFREVIELPWHRELTLDGLSFQALRPAHWGARTAVDRHRKFNAYVIEGGGGVSGGGSDHRRVLFAGDTAHTDAFNRIGPMDLSMFGIGAYDPWIDHHATPEQVWQMYCALTGKAASKPSGRLLALHHSTFRLGREPIDEPLRRLLAAAGPHAPRVLGRVPGEIWCEGEGEPNG